MVRLQIFKLGLYHRKLLALGLDRFHLLIHFGQLWVQVIQKDRRVIFMLEQLEHLLFNLRFIFVGIGVFDKFLIVWEGGVLLFGELSTDPGLVLDQLGIFDRFQECDLFLQNTLVELFFIL